MTALVNPETGEVEPTINYEVHPAADLFPLIEGDAFIALVEDIRVRGQEMPVVLTTDGRLLDGRNRVRACQALGIDVKETRYSGDDAFGFVISHNMHRRHLTESQRAMVAAKLANLTHGANRFQKVEPSIDGSTPVPVTTAEAAKALNVSATSVERARLVRDHGTPETQKAVESGELTVSKAAAAIREAIKPAVERLDNDTRVSQIRDLASQNLTSRQMSDRLNVSDDRIRRIARQAGVDIPADRTVAKTRRIDSMRVLTETITQLEGLAMGVDLIDWDDVSPQGLGEWAESLTTSLRALNKFAKQIKETTHA